MKPLKAPNGRTFLRSSKGDVNTWHDMYVTRGRRAVEIKRWQIEPNVILNFESSILKPAEWAPRGLLKKLKWEIS